MLKQLLIFTFAVVIFTGCQKVSDVLNSENGDAVFSDEAAIENQDTKEGYTTISGMVVKVGDGFVIIDELDAQHEIDSYSVDFASYVDTEVKVTGQYSGDTLFVSEIEPIPTPTY